MKPIDSIGIEIKLSLLIIFFLLIQISFKPKFLKKSNVNIKTVKKITQLLESILPRL